MTLLFAHVRVNAQHFDTEVQSADRTLEGLSLSGFVSEFRYSKSEVRKGWWDYARNFGNPTNMRSYYKVKVPGNTEKGTKDVIVYTQTTENAGNSVTFFLGLDTKGDTLQQQAAAMLVDFKRLFYIQALLSVIDAKEEQAAKLARSYGEAIMGSEREILLNKIALISREVEEIKVEIRGVERQ